MGEARWASAGTVKGAGRVHGDRDGAFLLVVLGVVWVAAVIAASIFDINIMLFKAASMSPEIPVMEMTLIDGAIVQACPIVDGVSLSP